MSCGHYSASVTSVLSDSFSSDL